MRRVLTDLVALVPYTIIMIVPLSPPGHVFAFSLMNRCSSAVPSPFTSQRQDVYEIYTRIADEARLGAAATPPASASRSPFAQPPNVAAAATVAARGASVGQAAAGRRLPTGGGQRCLGLGGEGKGRRWRRRERWRQGLWGGARPRQPGHELLVLVVAAVAAQAVVGVRPHEARRRGLGSRTARTAVRARGARRRPHGWRRY